MASERKATVIVVTVEEPEQWDDGPCRVTVTAKGKMWSAALARELAQQRVSAMVAEALGDGWPE